MSQYSLDRSVLVRALPATVFSFFMDSALFAEWWGTGSEIDARPGGAVRIVYPNGIVVSGEVVEVEPDRRIVFTYGYEDGAGPVPPGATTVEVTLDATPEGTLLQLTHSFEDSATRDLHVPGWRHQLAVFANLAARHQHADTDGLFDRFFAAQMVEDLASREAALAELVTESFTFRDTFACVRGVAELAAHLEAARAHGVAPSIERHGPSRQCQGTAVCDWIAKGPDGSVALTGTNVATLSPDGRLADVCGLWEMPH